MKKTIICNIPMKEKVDSTIYTSDDLSLPATSLPVMYPVNSIIGQLSDHDDQFKVLMLMKRDQYGHYKNNMNAFKAEFLRMLDSDGSNVEFVVIDTIFDQSKDTHEHLMCSLIENIEDNAQITADITYGPKDLPIIIFSALSFAEKHLNCNVNNIVYGQASFVDGHVVDTKLQDMSPLYYLSYITQSIRSTDSEHSREMLKSLLSM